MIPSDIIDWHEFLKDNGCENIVDYGEWISFNCIFHDQSDRTRPSLGIYKETGAANCFGCGKHTWEEVCEVFGISAEDFVEGIKERMWQNFKRKILKKDTSKKYKRYKLPSQLSNPYGNRECIKYFNDRGINKLVLMENGVRYCRDPYSKYFEYLIFPIYDEKGVLFFDARCVEFNTFKSRWRRPKNSAVWKTYFNYENVKNGKALVLVEGATDALKMIQFGYPAIAAKTFSPYQIDKIIHSNVRYIFTMYDNDEAGRTAANKYGHPINFTAKANYVFGNCGIRVMDIKLPDYAKDPADIKYDSDILKCNTFLNEVFV